MGLSRTNCPQFVIQKAYIHKLSRKIRSWNLNQEIAYRAVLLVLMLTTFPISAYYRRRADRSGGKVTLREEGRVILNLRRFAGLAGFTTALVYLVYPPWVEWATWTLPEWARWGGAAGAAGTIPLVFWLLRSLGKNITPTVVTRKEHTLVTSGPYRWVRHPLYVVGTGFWLSLSLLTAIWLLTVMAVFGFFLMFLRTPLEEARLAEKFGEEYRAYCRRTGRFFPKLFRTNPIPPKQEG